MGYRADIIFKLERRLEKLTSILKEKYTSRTLVAFLKVEKDIQIQLAYQQAEGV